VSVRRPAVKRLALAVAAATAALTVPVATAAHAEPSQADSPSTARHCIADLAGGPVRCFDTFTEAVDVASNGRVDDAPSSARRAAGNGDFRASLKGSVIQGTFFTDTNYGGSSLTVYGPEPCVKDGWVNWQYDLPDGWKDVISSVQPWADCWIWLYPEPNLGGDRDGPFKENTPDIGAFMNDRTESIGFS
jgi:hypothetical protein